MDMQELIARLPRIEELAENDVQNYAANVYADYSHEFHKAYKAVSDLIFDDMLFHHSYDMVIGYIEGMSDAYHLAGMVLHETAVNLIEAAVLQVANEC